MDSPENENNRRGAEDFGTVPNAAASFGNVPNPAEIVRNDAASFRNTPRPAEARPKYTLTVREASRMFEAAGVARSERSIVNWCKRNGQLPGKLDADYDPNERKYFITLESVELGIAEERAKAVRHGNVENFREVPSGSGIPQPTATLEQSESTGSLKALQAEVMDLKITNRAKDYFINELKKEREELGEEREQYVEKLMSFNHRIGELESQLLQLREPADDEPRKIEILHVDPRAE